ncbi:hypothetical protein CROQUDRAFT_670590 [Cronartium quercuum f. sp. fusiforme G11]|uniref:Protein YOP1 n=1 Tax=Cronartium quercuum f. sp. fusiforme G11 TaxID=708437 RepID=A0A9P6NPM1_9BASI|nr:hypothetical protein CROQUDRAFT_670590 [Cronartium quercuum f. sp. fusiforme G11]
MGLFSFISFLIVTSLGTLYPIYLSYKAIKANDLQSLEVLLMYWIVMGSVTALENTLGWLVNWLPFYYEAKTILMLWLTLPQIQGSTYVYLKYLHPFLLEHETEIDALMVEAKEKCKKAGTDYLRKVIEKVKELVIGVVASQQSAIQPQSHPHAIADAQPDGRASMYAFNLLRQFGPAAAAVFQPMQNRDQAQHAGQPSTAYDQLLRATALPRSIHPASLGGYQIPEYEPRSIPEIRNSSGRRVSSPLPGSNTRMHHSSSGSGMSGYEEIMQDEASGSETEWIKSQSKRTITPINKPRASTGQIPDHENESTSLLNHQDSDSNPISNSNPTGPGWWFGWGGRPIEELKKKRD